MNTSFFRNLPFVSLFFLGVSGCAAAVPSDLESDSEFAAVESEDGKADSLSSTSTYYTMRHDYRRCLSPVCGGYWVARVNQTTTRCSDGSYAAECYVSGADFSELGLGAAQLDEVLSSDRPTVLRGVYARGPRFGGVEYKTFKVSELWQAATSAVGTGSFYRMTDSGIRCITSPCFSLHEARLNSRSSRNLSGLNLDPVGASEDAVADAFAALTESGGVIAVGANRAVRRAGPAGDGRELRATQFYLQVKPVVLDLSSCEVDADCGYVPYRAPVTDPSECYCTTCAVPGNLEVGAVYQEQHATFCSGVELRCPLFPCAAPPPVGCVDHVCQYVPEF